jgi:hypothetical protein
LNPKAQRVTKGSGKDEFHLFTRKATHLKELDRKLHGGL